MFRKKKDKASNDSTLELELDNKFDGKYYMARPLGYWLSNFIKVDLLIMMLAGFAVVLGYSYLLTSNWRIAIMLSTPSLIFLLLIFIEIKKQEKFKEYTTKVMNYVNDMVFYMANDNNIAQSLELVYESATGEFKEDIQKTINEVENNGKLNTEHFKKYNMPTLDQFHKTLEGVYYNGTPSKEEVFIPVKDFLLQELAAQDRLRNNRKMFINVFNFMTAIALIAMPIIRFRAEELYFKFLAIQNVSFASIVLFEVMILGAMYIMQKFMTDVSVR